MPRRRGPGCNQLAGKAPEPSGCIEAVVHRVRWVVHGIYR